LQLKRLKFKKVRDLSLSGKLSSSPKRSPNQKTRTITNIAIVISSHCSIFLFGCAKQSAQRIGCDAWRRMAAVSAAYWKMPSPL
jgi:hypothetical protein